MKIYLGADHQGYHMKEQLFSYLVKHDYEVEDVGGDSEGVWTPHEPKFGAKGRRGRHVDPEQGRALLAFNVVLGFVVRSDSSSSQELYIDASSFEGR